MVKKAKPKTSKTSLKKKTKLPPKVSPEGRAKQKKAASAGGKASSRAGIRNKRTIETMQRLEELGCDPIEFNAKVMLGQELKSDHEFLPTAMKLINRLINHIDALKRVDKKKLIPQLENLRDEIYEGLARSETPHEYRVQMGKELIKYVAPQLKAMDVKALLDGDGVVHLHFDKQDADA